MTKQDLKLVDFGASGLTVREAMLSQHRDRRKRREPVPRFILWNGTRVFSSIEVVVPRNGAFTLSFVTKPVTPAQGIDILPRNGHVAVPDLGRVDKLRTWHEEGLNSRVSYEYFSELGRLVVYNVFAVTRGGANLVEYGTGNAGFTVETIGDVLRLCCSDGLAATPDFGRLVVDIMVATLGEGHHTVPLTYSEVWGQE